jgi:hypothetical protein
MPNILEPAIALPVAFVFLVAAGVSWYFLVRPVPEKTATGAIAERTFQAAELVERSVPRTTRSLEYTPQEIRYSLPDRHIYRVRLDHDGTEVYFTAPATALPPLDVGRAVRLVYVERYIPLLGRRIFVKEMAPTD